MGFPSIQILSSCDTFIPGEAVSPLTVILSSSASLSASLLEQTPASLKNFIDSDFFVHYFIIYFFPGVRNAYFPCILQAGIV